MQNISVVLSCAGIGSRLGLGKTKALLNIEGYPLIAWQLALLKEVEDIRIVIGYQANAVVEAVLRFRKDVIFIYNHRYFETKTGESFFLGAKHANEYVIAFDGDLIIHPSDMAMLLQTQGEYIGYSEQRSQDTIFVNCNKKGDVVSFATKATTENCYEWTGPACVKKSRLIRAENVYNQLETLLPMRGISVRACDIDTYEDYTQAMQVFSQWYAGVSMG